MRCGLPVEFVFGGAEGEIPNESARTHHRTSKLAVIAVGLERTDSTSSQQH